MNHNSTFGLQPSAKTTMVDSVSTSNDILKDPSLSLRQVFVRTPVRTVVSLGRISAFHCLLMPMLDEGYPESVGDFLTRGCPPSRFANALEATRRLVAAVSDNEIYPVLFEHGNSGANSSARYGTKIAHMHCVWTKDREIFQEALLESLRASAAWVRIPGWYALPQVALLGEEYFFVQVDIAGSWCCRLSDIREPGPSQLLRKLIHGTFVKTNEHVNPNWAWQLADDRNRAENEAAILREEYSKQMESLEEASRTSGASLT